ncbi:unnamed protein product [[Candida] boidinii]|nr:unnamed protein product [[Candida] boidinii]
MKAKQIHTSLKYVKDSTMLLEYSTCRLLFSVTKWIKGVSRLCEICHSPAAQTPSTSRDTRDEIVNPEATPSTVIQGNRTTTQTSLLESL